MNNSDPIAATRQWLENVVVGLNLCPFARQPLEANKVRFVISTADSEERLLEDLAQELRWMNSAASDSIDTSILIVPQLLKDFLDYNNFLAWADELLIELDLEGILQIASFHPQYYFADTEPDDLSNFTNRSPFPLFHILREDLLEQLLEKYPDAQAIPERNIAKMRGLKQPELQRLFPYLFPTSDS